MKARGRRPSAFIVSRRLEPSMKPDARLFEMTSLMKQYQITQCYIFFYAIVCLIDVFSRHLLYLLAFLFKYPIVSRCTKFVFQKYCKQVTIGFGWPKKVFPIIKSISSKPKQSRNYFRHSTQNRSHTN